MSRSAVCGVSCFILKVSFESLSVSVFPPFLLPSDFHLRLVVSPAFDCSHLCCSALGLKRSLSHFWRGLVVASSWFSWLLVYVHWFGPSSLYLFPGASVSFSLKSFFSTSLGFFCLFSSLLWTHILVVFFMFYSKQILVSFCLYLGCAHSAPLTPGYLSGRLQQQQLRLGVKWRSCAARL